MSRCRRLVLAGFCCSVAWALANSAGSAGTDEGAMARAALPPPLRPDQSNANLHQTPRAQTQSARREPSGLGLPMAGSRKPHNHTSKHPPGEISALVKKPRGPSEYHKRRRLDGANLAARSDKPLDRQTLPGFTREQTYYGPQDASTPETPIIPLLPRFGYNPAPPPGYGYPSVYQPPWLPGPTPPR